MSTRQTILLVDDDPTVLNMLARALEESYEVLIAGDGVDAVYVYERNLERVAAVVTDLEMPRLNGQSLSEWLHHIRPQLPVIIMSGSFRRQALRDLTQRPMTSFLGKPFETAQLEEVLHNVLDINEGQASQP
ncbi:MAG: response regulator receiver protein [Acidobacteria bacterium]|nr:response regulator receiver protein [Acidobacteriota bacterium]